MDTAAKFEDALFELISKHQPNSSSDKSEETKSILDNITSSHKVELKMILQLIEEVPHNIFLHRAINREAKSGENNDIRNSLFVEGLSPDIAWRFQVLLDNWHQSNPSLYPSVRLSIYNLRLKFANKALNDLYEFFGNVIEFNKILSQKDLFTKEEIANIHPDKITTSIFKNHLEIYIRKDFKEMAVIPFLRPDNSTENPYAIMISDIEILRSICEIIKPKIEISIKAIMDKAIELGFNQDQTTKIYASFMNNFSIAPLIGNDEFKYYQEQANNLFLRKIPTSYPTDESIDQTNSDIDILHYIRSLADSDISIEELLSGSTKFVHESELNGGDRSIEDESIDRYNLSKISGKPLIRTKYFLSNSHKFFIINLDLSNIRLISQPDMEILSKFKHLKTLILNNSRPCGEFNIMNLEFGKMKRLENLCIRNCSVTKLSRSMFRNSSCLRRVYATGNAISSIDSNCFMDSPIEELHLDQSDMLRGIYPEEITKILNKTGNNNQERRMRIFASIQERSIK